MRQAMMAMVFVGTLFGAGSALAEDARSAEVPVVLAAGDALGLAVWGEAAQEAARQEPAKAVEPTQAVPAAIPEE